MSDQAKDDADLAQLIEYFGERLNRVFAYFFFVLEFEDEPDLDGDLARNDRTLVLQTIQNACMHATLTAIRDLDDVLALRSPKSRKDDLKISDFGHLEDKTFLTNFEREQINKAIVHTTIPGASWQEVRWNIWELASKCILQSIAFLKWVETRDTELLLSALPIRAKIEKIHSYISTELTKRTN